MKINYLIYSGMTPLDMFGAAQVWAAIPNVKTQYVASEIQPQNTDTGVCLLPTHTFETAEPEPDIFFIPGGAEATFQLANDPVVQAFVKKQGEKAKWVTSVCTGAIVLASAGLLTGFRATTHWAAMPALSLFGAKPEQSRWVIDGNRATGGGVTAGIDFGLAVMAEICGEEAARRAQLALEYQPQPPFNSGSPDTANAEDLDAVIAGFSTVAKELEAIAQKQT